MRWRSILGPYDKVDGLIASIHAKTEFHDIILHEFSRRRGANVRESVPFIYFNSRLVDFCNLRAACTGIGPAMAFMSGQLSSPRRSFEPVLGLARGAGVVLKYYTPSHGEFAKQHTRNYVLFVSRYYRLDDMYDPQYTAQLGIGAFADGALHSDNPFVKTRVAVHKTLPAANRLQDEHWVAAKRADALLSSL